MRKIAFLDRDGVINKEIGGYICHKKDFEILPHVAFNCKKLLDKGFEIVLVTNQGGIAKEMYSIEDLHEIHSIMLEYFTQINIPILEVFYCPHHHLISKCLCRKPKGLMIEKALKKYNGDIESSFLIGDNQRDIDAAIDANLNKYFLIDSNQDWAYIIDLIN